MKRLTRFWPGVLLLVAAFLMLMTMTACEFEESAQGSCVEIDVDAPKVKAPKAKTPKVTVPKAPPTKKVR
ncbi:hypothetical protein ABZ445_16135 [Streptomyces chartreusis]|uniref:hypothetical protein n=1 Tax=Streptomyces chartreusis TaxID=1969 RepID=UPI0033CD1BE7